jgi:MSHA biogenesis protein MshM
MYYAHFGLKQPPFKITPNTEFFFSGGNRGAVLDALIYAITSGEGIIKVVGEVGSGKTMLCRMLQTLLPEKVESVYLANPSVAPEDILHAIAFELQLNLPKNADRLQVMQVLQSYLLQRHADSKQVVIFVEEAQGMPLATLEEIRLLSNLETRHDKLLQIVLFGQPELDVNLNETRIRQLRERITHSFNLGPLEEKEIGEYLIFRLRAAGYFGPHLFTNRAIRKLSKAAEGLVRRVNILADKALLSAFSENLYQVTPKHVRAAIRDSEFGAEQARRQASQRLYVAATVTLVVGLTLGYLLNQWWVKRPAGQGGQQAVSQAASLLQQKSEQKAEEKIAEPVSPQHEINRSQNAKLVAAKPAQVPVNTSAVSAPPVPAAAPVIEPSDILERRLNAAHNWLNQHPASTVTVQLMGGGDEGQMRTQLEALASQIELDKIYLFRTKVSGKPFMILTYGSYSGWNEAAQAKEKLPRAIIANRPRLRTIGGILEETKQFQ